MGMDALRMWNRSHQPGEVGPGRRRSGGRAWAASPTPKSFYPPPSLLAAVGRDPRVVGFVRHAAESCPARTTESDT